MHFKRWPLRRMYALLRGLLLVELFLVLIALGYMSSLPIHSRPRTMNAGQLATIVEHFLWSRFGQDRSNTDRYWRNVTGVRVGIKRFRDSEDFLIEFDARETCPPSPVGLRGPLAVNTAPASEDVVRNENPNVNAGGRYRPTHCNARSKVAIIIPFFGDQGRILIFLRHMHPIWQRQRLHYRVYVIVQTSESRQNRGKLLNVGFAVADADDKYDCFVFHDPDLMLEDDRCSYHCPVKTRKDGSGPIKQLLGCSDSYLSDTSGYDLGLCSPFACKS